MMNPFAHLARFEHPWLVALGAAGAVWFLASLVIAALVSVTGFGGRTLAVFVFVLHGLGLAAMVGAGVVYGLLFWRGFINEKFFS